MSTYHEKFREVVADAADTARTSGMPQVVSRVPFPDGTYTYDYAAVGATVPGDWTQVVIIDPMPPR